jgi:hypothetical protein
MNDGILKGCVANNTERIGFLYQTLNHSLHEPMLNGAAMNLLRKTCYGSTGWTSRSFNDPEEQGGL